MNMNTILALQELNTELGGEDTEAAGVSSASSGCSSVSVIGC